jgi:hypothetical protein
MHIPWSPSPQPLILVTSDTDITRLTDVFNNRIYCFVLDVDIYNPRILGAFAKLRKATIRLAMSVCLSVRPSVPMKQLGSLSTDFIKFDIWGLFENLSQNIKCHKMTRINGYFTWRPMYINDNISFIECGVFQKKVVQRNNLFRKSCRLWDNGEKHGRARQTAFDNIL